MIPYGKHHIDQDDIKSVIKVLKSDNLTQGPLIKIFENAGWHFNNILSPEEISLKLRTFAHSEFSDSKYSSSQVIKSKINSKIDLFERGHTYEKVELNELFPKYLIENKIKYKDFLL